MESNMQIFDELIKREPGFLDRPLEELLPMRFMGEVAVNAYQGLLKKLDNLPLSLEEKKSRLKDGQAAGKTLLMIETRIGELLPPPEETKRIGGKRARAIQQKDRDVPQEAHPGLSGRQAYKARQIASHPKEVEEIIKEAEENEDIPTKTAVLNKIAYKREKARSKVKVETTQLEMKANAYLYHGKLEEACKLIPSEPPSDLTEKDYIAIKAIALLIIHKLEVFNNGETITETKSLRR